MKSNRYFHSEIIVVVFTFWKRLAMKLSGNVGARTSIWMAPHYRLCSTGIAGIF